MTVPCISALPYPNCTDHVSIFTTAVFVLSTLSPKRCFYKEATPGCTMPANLTAENGFYPVLPNEMGNTSAYHGELLIGGAVNMTVSQSVTKVYLGANATGSVRIDQDNVVVRGIAGHALQQLTIGGRNVSVHNATIDELVFPRSNYTDMAIADVTVQLPVRFSPHGGSEAVNLDRSTISNLKGGVVSFLHPRGTIEINGDTEVLMLPLPPTRSAKFAITGNATSILDVADLTGIFGAEYLVEYEAGDLVLEAIEATQLAQTLILPTVIAVLTVIFGWGDRLRG